MNAPCAECSGSCVAQGFPGIATCDGRQEPRSARYFAAPGGSAAPTHQAQIPRLTRCRRARRRVKRSASFQHAVAFPRFHNNSALLAQLALRTGSLDCALQLREGAQLDLAHTLARNADLGGEAFQRHRDFGEAARLEDAAFAWIEHVERVDQRLMAARWLLRIRRACAPGRRPLRRANPATRLRSARTRAR